MFKPPEERGKWKKTKQPVQTETEALQKDIMKSFRELENTVDDTEEDSRTLMERLKDMFTGEGPEGTLNLKEMFGKFF